MLLLYAARAEQQRMTSKVYKVVMCMDIKVIKVNATPSDSNVLNVLFTSLTILNVLFTNLPLKKVP